MHFINHLVVLVFFMCQRSCVCLLCGLCVFMQVFMSCVRVFSFFMQHKILDVLHIMCLCLACVECLVYVGWFLCILCSLCDFHIFCVHYVACVSRIFKLLLML